MRIFNATKVENKFRLFIRASNLVQNYRINELKYWNHNIAFLDSIKMIALEIATTS